MFGPEKSSWTGGNGHSKLLQRGLLESLRYCVVWVILVDLVLLQSFFFIRIYFIRISRISKFAKFCVHSQGSDGSGRIFNRSKSLTGHFVYTEPLNIFAFFRIFSPETDKPGWVLTCSGLTICPCTECYALGRGTQREYSSKPLKDSIVKRVLVFKR